ncbi:unnamed protein product [Caenorhabditis bovis]|uniref:Fungal lipase-type domain-containing protein n=1 Tax=Caenorhabditis bovis TaxID=2654633 RepID=A0A8S1EAR6_9PELO|nr:unnamed protein product [Caenorhabditis bovis]
MRCLVVIFAYLVASCLAVFTALDKLYNETEARQMLKMVAATTAPNKLECIRQAHPKSEKYKIVEEFDMPCDFLGSPCSGYIAVSKKLKQMTLAFRSSETPGQLALQMWSLITPDMKFGHLGKVNRYFSRSHDIIWPSIQKTLNKKKFKDYDVVITGHSLGGALASLAAVRLVADGHRRSDQVKLFTYGEPRVGNLEFSRRFSLLVPYSFRIVHAIDLITRLPVCTRAKNANGPTSAGLHDGPCDGDDPRGSYHHGLEIWYPGDMKEGSSFTVCDGLPINEDFQCSSGVKPTITNATEMLFNHLYYFDVDVSAFGFSNCNSTISYKEPNRSLGIIGIFKEVSRWLKRVLPI